MKKLFVSLAVVAVAVTSCQKDVVYNDMPEQNQSVELPNSNTRSYDEALAIAEDALKLLEGDETRSTTKRVIKRNEGQTVLRPVTRGGEENEEPIMYVFNNEDNMGFTVVAANKTVDPLIAVTEQGNYTYGNSSGVEPFDLYIEELSSQLMSLPEPIPLPDQPIVPTPVYLVDTLYYNYSKVDAMLTTKWGQSGIYGKLCPNGLSGCSNTAAVQIMAHHRHPDILFTTYRGANNFDAIVVDWDGVLRHTEGIGVYHTSNNTYECNCGCNHEHISILMREVGYRSNTNYRVGASGADEPNIRNTLYLLGFGNPVIAEGISLEDYQGVIFEDLDNKRPLFVSGFDAAGGHAWVIDGYIHKSWCFDYYVSNPNYNPNVVYNPEPQYIFERRVERESNMLHFNWGWDGNCDGWFTYGCFAPGDSDHYDDETETNQSNYNFEFGVNLIYNIQPRL